MPAGWTRRAAVVLVVGLTAGACGSREPEVPDRLTACEVLTRAEVAEVLGGRVDPPTAAEAVTDTLAGRSGCAWSTTDGARAALIELVRTDDMAPSVRRTGFSASARFGGFRHDHPGAEPVPGLGDGAVFVESAGSIHVLRGRSYFTIEVASTPTPTIRGLAEQLAERAVQRLDKDERAD